MKKFVKKLKGKIIAKLIYTDNLFRFKRNKEEKMLAKAYSIGINLGIG